ncbi:hypothetical protein Y956_04669, partial [Nipponia nippon]
TLNFRRADFGLFRSLVDTVPWEAVLKGKGVQEGWTLFKEEVSKAQEQAIPMCRKSSRQGRRPAWLNRKLWLELKKKRRAYRLWKKGQATQEDYKDIGRLCREKIRKVKARLELNQARDVKNNKGINRYINQKRKVKESIPPLRSSSGKLVTTDEEKAEVLKNFFASVFTGNLSPHTSRVNGPFDGDQGGRGPPPVRED